MHLGRNIKLDKADLFSRSVETEKKKALDKIGRANPSQSFQFSTALALTKIM